MKHKKVWLLSGVPGSGKTTWVKKQIAEKGGVHCSRDEIRFSLLKEDEDYFAHEDEVVALWLEKVTNAINDPEVENIYVDATHLTENSELWCNKGKHRKQHTEHHQHTNRGFR
jgi:adenylate kinase